MTDINFIANYYLGTKAYTIFMLKTLYDVDEKNYIENKDYQLSAQVGFIANIMLSIKEELVEEPAVEAAPEEAPAVETETPVVEEVTDTVSEEKVDEVKE